MRKTIKMIGVAALLSAMVPLGAYAASGTDGSQASQDGAGVKERHVMHRFLPTPGFPGVFSQDLLDLLKLDAKTLREKLAEGKTLAQIAEEQGVSRDNLKQSMTDSFNRKLDEQKARFAENLDKMLDSARPQRGLPDKIRPEGAAGDRGFLGGKFHFTFSRDLNETAQLLGVTGDELKKALKEGKSLADLANEKGVEVQKLIDLQVNAWTQKIDQALSEGKITQEQAEKLKSEAVDIATKMVNAKGTRDRLGNIPGKPGFIPGKPGNMPGKLMQKFKLRDGDRMQKQAPQEQQQQTPQT
jgi:hypothetical protein